jgi:preprotein translocase subunit SecG
MTTSFLLIVQIVLVVMITIAVLLQKSSSIGLGAYSGSNESVFGAKGPASFLAKVTFTIGFLFVINTIALGYLYSQEAQSSVVDDMITTTQVVAPLSTVAAVVAEQNSTEELNTTK